MEYKFKQVIIKTEIVTVKEKNAKNIGFERVKYILYKNLTLYPKGNVYYIGNEFFPCFYMNLSSHDHNTCIENSLQKSILKDSFEKFMCKYKRFFSEVTYDNPV